MSETCSQIRQDRDMFLDRLHCAATSRGGSLIGLSSTALLLEVFGDGPVPLNSHPLDAADLRRCVATVHRLPAHRREAGEAILERFRATLRSMCSRRGGHSPWHRDDGTCWKCGDPLPARAAS